MTARLISSSPWTTAHEQYVSAPSAVTGSDGAWQLDLPAQTSFTDPASYWRIETPSHVWAVTVPDSGPVYVDDIIVSVPLTPGPPPPGLYLARTERGIANGVASLAADGLVPVSQLPGSSGGNPAWTDITGKPSTFPPTLPIAESGVTGLVADLAALSSSVSAKADSSAVTTALALKQDAATATTDTELAAGLATRAPKTIVRSARIVGGNPAGNAPPDTSGQWLPFAGVGELGIPAVIGDHIELNTEFVTVNDAGSIWDIGVKVGASVVWFASSDSSAPTGDGDPGMAPFPATRPFGGGWCWLDVGAEHIGTGIVTFVLMSKSSGGGKIFYAESNHFRWRAINYGQVV